MSPLRLSLLLSLLFLVGCGAFDDAKRQEESERLSREDSARRQARLRSEGKLNDREYETVSDKMGWSRSDARGLPAPPTTEELEKRVKAGEAGR